MDLKIINDAIVQACAEFLWVRKNVIKRKLIEMSLMRNGFYWEIYHERNFSILTVNLSISISISCAFLQM